ncbi:MAG: hypothetical protein AAFP04_08885 [Myxococcota bacterium]
MQSMSFHAAIEPLRSVARAFTLELDRAKPGEGWIKNAAQRRDIDLEAVTSPKLQAWLVQNGLHPEFAKTVKRAMQAIAISDAHSSGAYALTPGMHAALNGITTALGRPSGPMARSLRALQQRAQAKQNELSVRVVDVDNPVVPGNKQPTRVAAIQYTPDARFSSDTLSSDPKIAKHAQLAQLDRNQSNLEALVSRAVDGGARVIVTPELGAFGYESEPHRNPNTYDRTITWGLPELQSVSSGFRKAVSLVDPKHVAESVPDGALTRRWVEHVKKLYEQCGEPVYVVFHVLEKIDRARAERLSAAGEIELYEDHLQKASPLKVNEGGLGESVYATTAIAVGPKGVEAVHRKTQRWQNEHYLGTARGLTPNSFETPYGKFGLAVCLGFISDDIFAEYRDTGVDAVLFPSDWAANHGDAWVGPSRDSFEFIADRIGLDLIAADDRDSGRTGIYAVKNGQAESIVHLHRTDPFGHSWTIPEPAIVRANVHY